MASRVRDIGECEFPDIDPACIPNYTRAELYILLEQFIEAIWCALGEIYDEVAGPVE